MQEQDPWLLPLNRARAVQAERGANWSPLGRAARNLGEGRDALWERAPIKARRAQGESRFINRAWVSNQAKILVPIEDAAQRLCMTPDAVWALAPEAERQAKRGDMFVTRGWLA